MSSKSTAITKFVIRDALKELQSRRAFSSMEELTEAVVEELLAEGLEPDDEDRAKIARVVEQHGYTGRFAFDDVLRRRFGNSRWLPWFSLAGALLVFLLSSSVAAIIEHYVQRPLEDGKVAAPVSATFQVPETVGDLLTFRVTLRNLTSRPLSQLVLFASAGGVAQQYTLESLEVGATETVSGVLDVTQLPQGKVDFVAYVIAGDFSLCCSPTEVAREPREVAVLNAEESAAPESRGAALQAPSVIGSSERVVAARKGHSLSSASEPGPAVAASPTRSAPATRTLPAQARDPQQEIARLSAARDPASRALLEAYAAAGHLQARRSLQGG